MKRNRKQYGFGKCEQKIKNVKIRVKASVKGGHRAMTMVLDHFKGHRILYGTFYKNTVMILNIYPTIIPKKTIYSQKDSKTDFARVLKVL